jgi:hypothetical protein
MFEWCSRDFCNGFLVAEIFSRYYDKDFQMHSYDNGMSLKVRKDNWKLLLKMFRRVSRKGPSILALYETCDWSPYASMGNWHRLWTNVRLQDGKVCVCV